MEDNNDVIYDSGFSTPVTCVCMEDAPAIVKAVSLHTTVLPVKTELDQMAEGLELFGIIRLIREHPSLMQPLFVFDPVDAKLTVDQIVQLFDVVFSPEGSTKRIAEEATFMHWNDFIYDLANGLIGKDIVYLN